MQCVYLKGDTCLGGLPPRFPTLQRYKPTDEELEKLCRSNGFADCPRYKEIKKTLKT